MICSTRPVTTLGYLVELLSIHPPLRARIPCHFQPHHRFSTTAAPKLSRSAWVGREALRTQNTSHVELKDVPKTSSDRFTNGAPNVEFNERKRGRKKSSALSEGTTERHGDSDAAQIALMEGTTAPVTPNGPRRRAQKGNRLSKSSSRASTSASKSPTSSEPKPRLEIWQIQKRALESKFGEEKWTPRKRLSPDTVDGIRTMHASDPDKFTTPILADHFRVSPEAIRRILRSKWRPRAEEMEDRRRRWENRGEKIWSQLAELGTRPPKKWREMGVGKGEDGEAPKWKKRPERKDRPLRKPVDIAVKDVMATRRRDTIIKETFSDRML
jgi:hypothetical protein